MENEEIIIDDAMYMEPCEPEDVIAESKNLLEGIDEQYTDKVIRIILKGQLDGN